MSKLVPFSYGGTLGGGYVPEEALKTFQTKATALATAMSLKNAIAHEDCQKLAKAMRSIIAANRKLKAKGWYLYSQKEYAFYLKEGTHTGVAA